MFGELMVLGSALFEDVFGTAKEVLIVAIITYLWVLTFFTKLADSSSMGLTLCLPNEKEASILYAVSLDSVLWVHFY